MMDKIKKSKEKAQLYGPNEREFEEIGERRIVSHSKNDYVELPDNVIDPIVSNNIVNAEFDYTKDSVLKTSKDDINP